MLHYSSRIIIAVVGMALVNAACAFSPAEGLWWNPNESGRGYTIDFQNGALVVLMYVYDANGNPLFYQAAGIYDENTSTLSSPMAETHGGPCFGCPYTAPTVSKVGDMKVVFDTPETGTLYFPGGSTRIQHETYAYTNGDRNEYLYGEWAFDINIGSGIFDTAWVVFDGTYTSNDGTRYISGYGDGISGTVALGVWSASLGKFLVIYSDNVGYSHEYVLTGDDRRLLGLGTLYLTSESPPLPTSLTSGNRLLFRSELSGNLSPVSLSPLRSSELAQIPDTRLQALADKLGDMQKRQSGILGAPM